MYHVHWLAESSIVELLATSTGKLMKRFLKWASTEWWQPLVLAIMAAPIAVYGYTFGWRIVADSGEWASMGSAMAGIYGPILAVLTFVVLLRQLRLQRQATEIQVETTKHMFVQSFVQDARADIEFYLSELSGLLDTSLSNGLVPRLVLQGNFERVAPDQLRSEQLRDYANALNASCPKLQALWMAILPILSGLSTLTESPHHMHLVGAKQKAIAMLSYRTCVAMDNYLYCSSEGRMTDYYFSEDLTQA